MVKIVNFEEFFLNTMGGRPCQLNTSIYDGCEYDCGCGERHTFYSYTARILRELPVMKLVLENDCGYCTLVQISGLFSYKFTSKLSACVNSEENISDENPNEELEDYDSLEEEIFDSEENKKTITEPPQGFKVIRKI